MGSSTCPSSRFVQLRCMMRNGRLHQLLQKCLFSLSNDLILDKVEKLIANHDPRGRVEYQCIDFLNKGCIANVMVNFFFRF